MLAWRPQVWRALEIVFAAALRGKETYHLMASALQVHWTLIAAAAQGSNAQWLVRRPQASLVTHFVLPHLDIVPRTKPS